MIRACRIVLRLALLLPWIILGLLSVFLVYPFLRMRRRAWMNRGWSRVLLWICGLRVEVGGEPALRGPVLFVANHVSWVDIFVMNAVRPTAFIAKSEIREWPVLGWLVAGAGTLFIERGQRRAVHGVGLAMRARFQLGEAVGLFPEGTTSEGVALLPFHSSLFEPARFAGAPIQPLALRYAGAGQPQGFPAFIGEETLVANVCRLLGAARSSVLVRYMPLIAIDAEAGAATTRATLSGQSRAAIGEALGLPPETP